MILSYDLVIILQCLTVCNVAGCLNTLRHLCGQTWGLDLEFLSLSLVLHGMFFVVLLLCFDCLEMYF